VPAQRLGDGVAGEAAPQKVVDDLPALGGRRASRHALAREHARDALGLVLGGEFVHQLPRGVAIDAARVQLPDDPEPAPSLHPSRRPDVRGGNASIVERPVCGQAVDKRISVAWVETA
jgi:hypothetical protein